MTAPNDTTLKPPYGPFETFRSFIGFLKKAVIPTHIDASIMQNMSGSVRSQMRGALTFLGLTDENGAVTQLLRNLVAAFDTPSWEQAWGKVFDDAYRPIIGDLSIEAATLKQLVDRFRDKGGVSGSVLRKAIRFYLEGLKESGSSASPHFNTRGLSVMSGDRAQRPKGLGRSSSPATKSVGSSGSNKPARAVPTPSPDELIVQLPSRPPFVIPLPADLTDAEWNFIDAHVRAYRELRKGI